MEEFTEVYNDGIIYLARSAHGWNLKMRSAVKTLLVRDLRLVVAILQLAKQDDLLKRYGLL